MKYTLSLYRYVNTFSYESLDVDIREIRGLRELRNAEKLER